MFKKPIKTDSRVSSILGEGSEFKGTLTYNGTIRIDGSFEGEIISNGGIIISETAKVKADMLTKAVVISGSFEGELTAKERIELLPTAKVKGNLRSPSLSIADGVVLEGQCVIDKSLKESSKTINLKEKIG